MDTLRGSFGSFDDDARDEDYGDDETGREAPPSPVGQDERRMQVRAYNHWASLLQDRKFPAIDDLDAANLPDFGPHSVLLDFSAGIENPGIRYLGGALAEECGAGGKISSLDDVPSRSLLSRITDHYMQILANEAPIGFEAEFVNQRSATILYRGILLPFSSDDETIDFIYGIINWKEVADQLTTDELLLEIDQALEGADPDEPEAEFAARAPNPVTDWADGPALDSVASSAGEGAGDEGTDADRMGDEDWHSDGIDDSPISEFALPDLGELDEEDTIDQSAYASLAPSSELDDSDAQLSGLSGLRNKPDKKPLDLSATEMLSPLDTPEADVSEDAGEEAAKLELPASAFDERGDSFADLLGSGESDEASDDWATPLGSLLPGQEPVASEPVAEPVPVEPAVPANDRADAAPEAPAGAVEPDAHEAAGLYDMLAEARELAQAARSSEDRSRTALYNAVSRAYDVSLAAAEAPEDFAELVEENGLTAQDRAPMTPVVKLVFGADYDKTRLTEYAAVLDHAHRKHIERGALSDFLTQADGGLKGVVQAERRLRREESGQVVEPVDAVRASLAKKLRKLDPMPLDAIASDGAEFGVVMIRRLENGEIAVLGEVEDDIKLVEKVARSLLG